MRFKRGFSALLLAVAVVALDRATKHWAMRTLAQPVVALEGVLRWRYCENTGAAFSALSGSGTVVLVLSAILLVVLAAYLLFRPRIPWGAQLCLWAVVAGGASNLFDRLAWGFVVDFIHVLFFDYIFNFADCCITVGAVLFVIHVLFFTRSEENSKGKEES